VTGDLAPSPLLPARTGGFPVPAIIADAGEKASEHFLGFFAATIRNKNTRAAYMQAVVQFCRWCEEHELRLAGIRPLHMSAYIEALEMSAPSVKQHLAALRGLFKRPRGAQTCLRSSFAATPSPACSLAGGLRSLVFSRLILTPVGTISTFGFTTPVPYPNGIETLVICVGAHC
jgi:hypothetical protein